MTPSAVRPGAVDAAGTPALPGAILAATMRRCDERLAGFDPVRETGTVVKVAGPLVESTGPSAAVGEICPIWSPGSDEPIIAEVVGFRDHRLLLMAYGSMDGLRAGAEVRSTGRPLMAPVGERLLGRILDGLGRPIDSKGPLEGTVQVPVAVRPPHPLERELIREPLGTGIRSIDGLMTVGRGQRIGIFAGSGVGKSVLLGTIARRSDAEVIVVALVGERGREVREFLERDLTSEGLARSVVVVATSEQPPLVRVKAALLATRIAEQFRDCGKHVLLMMDSLTRFAMAQREVGLLVGEPPTTKGYTPSCFAALPQLLERAGMSDRGSVTGLYTVLVEGDDLNDPVADAARSVLDGHIVLSRRLAVMNHYPAVDVLESVSRVMPEVALPGQMEAAARVREWLAAWRESEDLIQLGAYVIGTNPLTDRAIERRPEIVRFLRQASGEGTPLARTVSWMIELATAAPGGAPGESAR
jgi:flagellum-specific ATP synthase